jgi:hypothetical protein
MVALVALSAAVIACGGGSDDAVPAVTEAPVTTQAPAAAPTPGYGAPASTDAVSAADHVVVTAGLLLFASEPDHCCGRDSGVSDRRWPQPCVVPALAML